MTLYVGQVYKLKGYAPLRPHLQRSRLKHRFTMEVFSHYGVGIKAYSIERKPNERVEFTLWITVFFMPLFPLSSWSAIYEGELIPDGIREDGHRFTDEVRISRGLLSHLHTFTLALLILLLAIAPILLLIDRTAGRAATPVEMVFVFAAAAWPVFLVLLLERHRGKKLKDSIKSL